MSTRRGSDLTMRRSNSWTRSAHCRWSTPNGCWHFRDKPVPSLRSRNDVAEARHKSGGVEPNYAAPLQYLQRKVMPMLQSNVFKNAALGAAVLIVGLIPQVALATLGQPEITVQTDVVLAHAAIKSMQDRTSYRVHEIQ